MRILICGSGERDRCLRDLCHARGHSTPDHGPWDAAVLPLPHSSVTEETAEERLSGCSDGSIMFKTLLPNMLGPLAVNASTQIGSMMIGIAGLSFLGIGVQEPQAEWGSMISASRAYIQLAPWAVLAPAAATILTVMIFNYLGDCVRDVLDVEVSK